MLGTRMGSVRTEGAGLLALLVPGRAAEKKKNDLSRGLRPEPALG